MKTLLSTAAIAAMVAGLSVPAYAQQTEDSARKVSPDEYFGTKARDAKSNDDAKATQQNSSNTSEDTDADNAFYDSSEEPEATLGQQGTPDSADQDVSLAERLRRRDAQRRAEGEQPATMSRTDDSQQMTTETGEPVDVSVRVTGVKKGAGKVYAALQSESGFANAGGEYTAVVDAKSDAVDVVFEGVEPGEYAIAVFQDTDGDGSVTIGRTGPTEPWALSGKSEGAPSFESAAMDVTGTMNTELMLSSGKAMKKADTAAKKDMSSEDGATVTVRIRRAEPDGGDFFVALQDEQGFAKAGGAYAQTAKADGRSGEVVFENVKPGAYAAAVFQDANGDEELTLTDTGPTEPWGFSGRRSRGAPEWDRAMFDVEEDASVTVRLREGSPEPDNDTSNAASPSDEELPDPVAVPETEADERAANEAEMEGTTTSETRPMADTDRIGDMDMPSESDAATSEATGPAVPALVYRQAATLAPDALTATDFLGADFVNGDGDELAQIEDIIVDPSGSARGVVLATGGVFGLGADYYAINFDRVEAVREDGELVMQSALSEADVERLRAFEYNEFKTDKQGLLLASELRGMSLAIGQTGETAEVADIIMSASGTIEAVVLSMDDENVIAPFDLVRAGPDGDLFVDVNDAQAGDFARYEGRMAEKKRGIRAIFDR